MPMMQWYCEIRDCFEAAVLLCSTCFSLCELGCWYAAGVVLLMLGVVLLAPIVARVQQKVREFLYRRKDNFRFGWPLD